MSQEQPSSPEPQQTNWLKVTIVTAIVGGVIQVIVNHFDPIVAYIATVFSLVNLPPVQSTPVFSFLNITSAFVVILSTILAIFSFIIINLRIHRWRHMQKFNEGSLTWQNRERKEPL